MLSTDASTSGSLNVYRIDPLKGAKNYSVWKIKMTDILTDMGYWDVVSRREQRPVPVSEAATISEPSIQSSTGVAATVATTQDAETVNKWVKKD
jgi:hypothetical protein